MLAKKLAAICLIFATACLGDAWGQAEGPQRYFNIKAGPVYVVVSAGVSTEYTDNINLSSGKTSPVQSELTIYPNIGITAATQVRLIPSSETNTSDLRLTANIGYRDYVFHSQLNEKVTDINLAPDSELSLLIHVGDYIKIRLHDGFSLQSDPATASSSLSNVAVFRRFVNTVGVDTQWDVNSKTRVNFAYNHSNLYALSFKTLGNNTANNISTNQLNSSTDTVSLSAGCQVLSVLNIGFTSIAQATSFPSAPSQDSTSISYGPTATLRLTEYTTLTASYGITQVQPGNSISFLGNKSTAPRSGGNTTGNYYDLTLANKLNSYYTHTLSIGRQITLDLLGSQTEIDYLRYTSAWLVNAHISIATSLFAENNTNLGLIGNSYHYRRYGCSFNTSYQLSRKMYTTLAYRYINKVADDPAQSYKQNTVTWTVNYQF